MLHVRPSYYFFLPLLMYYNRKWCYKHSTGQRLPANVNRWRFILIWESTVHWVMWSKQHGPHKLVMLLVSSNFNHWINPWQHSPIRVKPCKWSPWISNGTNSPRLNLVVSPERVKYVWCYQFIYHFLYTEGLPPWKHVWPLSKSKSPR